MPGRAAATPRRVAAALALVTAAGAATAHDTWFAPDGDGSRLLLGTGTRFPAHEIGAGFEHLVAGGCRAPDGRAVPLAFAGSAPAALGLRPAEPLGKRLSCWAQLAPVAFELTPAIVAVYLDEIQAPAAVRATWVAQRARGVTWRERYTKHARIELGGAGAAAAVALPTGLDLRLDGAASRPGELALRPGQAVAWRLFANGRPLPGVPLELQDASGAPGSWQTTDGDGRVRFTLGAAGRWLLRGTWLRPDGQSWVSDFVTLAFDVQPEAQPDRSSTRPKARSANQAAASAAVASEPSPSTPTR